MKKTVLAFILLLFSTVVAQAAQPMNNYCVVPPFIQQSIPPNLLLLIDNSASMYDPAYQDTGTTYCANSPTTACTVDSTCTALSATCLASTTSSTTSSTSAKACTSDANCPSSSYTYTAKACTSNADCTASGSKCSSSFCTKCNTTTGVGDCVVATHPCNNGFCSTCYQDVHGVWQGDCTTTTQTTYTPVSCTTDATCSAITTGDTCNNKCNTTRQCYDNTYNPATTYTGYFLSGSIYSYDVSNFKFTAGASMPVSCTYSAGATKYLCVNTTGTPEQLATDGSGFTANGNFLNWLTASKFDLEKQILTGGKYDTSNSVLVAETRGCAGRKFIKAIPGVNLTFAVRGGTPGGISATQSLATEYGQTYIDIYTGTYNTGDCLKAMNDWMNISSVNLGPFQNDTKGCIGSSSNYATNVWNHILHNCYQGLTGGAQGYSTNLNSLEIECKSIFTSATNPILPSAITDPNSGIAVCSSVLSYTDSGGTARTGYMGACYNTATGVWDDSCALTQMTNYCQLNVSSNPVVDPSSTSLTGSASSVPGFILEQGLSNTNLVGSMTVKVNASAPTGLIQQFSSAIRFGAMAFNVDGSASECGTGTTIPCSKYCSTTATRLCYKDSDCPSGETCNSITIKDASKIISFVGAGYCSVHTSTSCAVNIDCPTGEYCIASVGDHAGGLVKSLGDLMATTWTPHAEAYYNAIAYFAKDAKATNAALPTSFAASTATTSDAQPIAAPLTSNSGSVTSDSYTNKNPIQYRCQQNNILIITDGSSTADKNSVMTNKVTDASGNFRDPATTSEAATCGSYAGTPYLHDLSYYAKNKNIFDPTISCSGTSSTCEGAQTIRTYAVYTGATSTSTNICDPYYQLYKTAQNGGTTLYSAANAADLSSSLNSAFLAVSATSASGTAASILSNSEGSGASLLQALFYPMKYFDKTYSSDTFPSSATWIGELQDFWYYLDPFLQKTSIREDTNADYKLTLNADKIIQFYFDATQKKTLINKYSDLNGDGLADSSTPDTGGAGVSPDLINSLWRAGQNLWARNLTTSPRTIYTGYNSAVGSTPQLFSKTDTTNFNMSTVQTIMQIPTTRTDGVTLLTTTERTALTSKLIDYIKGTDQAADTSPVCLLPNCQYRPRKVTIQSYCPIGTTSDFSACTHEWRLGDIISSTPKLVSPIRLNNYNLAAPTGYNDTSYNSFVNGSSSTPSVYYSNRGMAFVGANDGMLHAFKLGVMQELNGQYDKAQLKTSTGSTVASNLKAEVGQEAWAYIPKHVLPYLIYQSDPNYSHLYSVDRSPLIVDASIGVPTGCTSGTDYSLCSKQCDGTDATKPCTWRTILIGGMGIGGASRDTSLSHPLAVPPPVTVGLNEYGYSTYFALDITDPVNPKYLWEFSNPLLGFSTTGPAIVRVAAKQKNTDGTDSSNPDNTKNGKWFAVFVSGPNGPINTTSHSFKGQSDQQLRVFIVDLADGSLKRTIDARTELGIDHAFGGSLSNSVIDIDRNNTAASGFYSDDAVYIGYTQLDDSSCTAPTDFSANSETCKWTKGGVLRLTTKENTDPDQWVLSKVIDGTGPVTTAIAKLQDRGNKNLWLFWGTGRFYYKTDDTTSTQQALYGVKDPCYNTSYKPGNYFDPTCTAAVSGTIVDQSGNSTAPATTLSSTAGGWKILLDGPDTTNNYMTERVITDTLAVPNGAVFFTTFKPSSDLCNYGGNSLLWAVRYDTGAAPPAAAMQGKALMQVSTGAFKEITLSTAFSNPGSTRYDGRRLNTPIVGVPPTAQGLSLFSNPPPVKRILQIQEK